MCAVQGGQMACFCPTSALLNSFPALADGLHSSTHTAQRPFFFAAVFVFFALFQLSSSVAVFSSHCLVVIQSSADQESQSVCFGVRDSSKSKAISGFSNPNCHYLELRKLSDDTRLA